MCEAPFYAKILSCERSEASVDRDSIRRRTGVRSTIQSLGSRGARAAAARVLRDQCVRRARRRCGDLRLPGGGRPARDGRCPRPADPDLARALAFRRAHHRGGTGAARGHRPKTTRRGQGRTRGRGQPPERQGARPEARSNGRSVAAEDRADRLVADGQPRRALEDVGGAPARHERAHQEHCCAGSSRRTRRRSGCSRRG